MVIDACSAFRVLLGFSLSQLPTGCEPTERVKYLQTQGLFDMMTDPPVIFTFSDGTALEHISSGKFRLFILDRERGC